jgi:hypothetical protein
MMRRFLSLTLLPACAAAPDGALLIPADVDVTWDEAWNGVDDGVAAFVPVDVMAYDAATGDALPGVPVGLLIDGVAAEAIAPRDLLVPDDDCGADCGDEWDAWGDRWVAPTDAGAASLDGVTDDDGLVRWTVRIDAFPTSAGTAMPQAVSVFGLDLDETFLIAPR